MTAALVCVHAAELLGRVAAFDRYAALDFGGGICSFSSNLCMYCTMHRFSMRAGDFVDKGFVKECREGEETKEKEEEEKRGEVVLRVVYIE